MSELKVKPCPFCGSDDISFSAFSLSPDAYALCGHCNAGIEIQVGWDEMTEKEHDEVCNLELQKAWNRRAVEQPQLNENQKIVLEYLKTRFGKHGILVKSVFVPINDLLSGAWNDDVDIALEQLDLKQEIQVLEVFSQWALGQEEEK